MRIIWGVVGCVVAGGCTASGSDTGMGGGPGGPAPLAASSDPPTAEELALYEELFDIDTVSEFRIELDDAAIAALDLNPKTYVEGSLEYGDLRFERVGVKLKGNGSFQGWGGKPAFKIRLDKYEDDQSLAHMRRLTLNSMNSDPTQAHEAVAWWLWAAAGMSVPRCAYARVYVNGESYGLHALLESVDEEFLDIHQRYENGSLWAAGDDSLLEVDQVGTFALVSGPGGPVLAEAARVLDLPTDDYYANADTVLDMDQFLDFFVWDTLTGNADGYPYHPDDYFLYADPQLDGRLTWMPWGMDETWSDTWEWGWGIDGTVANDCLKDSKCHAAFLDHAERALDYYERSGVRAYAEHAFAVSGQDVLDDPRRGYTPEEVALARAAFLDTLDGWPARVRAALGL